MNKVGSSCLLFLCSLPLAGTLSAQGPPASSGLASPRSNAAAPSINVQDLLLPHGNCGASSRLSFADATTQALVEQVLKMPSRRRAATLAPTTRFLPQVIPGIDATSDITVNATLTEGNVISGSIFGSGTPTSITAWDGAGNSYSGTIDPQMSTYWIVVGPGMYNLTLCRQNLLPPFNFPGPTDTFTDPMVVDATQGDVTHDITIPDLTLFDEQGRIIGIDPTLSNIATFVSTDGTVGASALLDPSGHYGGFPAFDLPAGTYIVSLNEIAGSSSFSSYVLGTVTITAPGTVPDQTKPSTTTLSGTASIDGTPPPGFAFVTAAEPVTPPPPGSPPTCYSMPVNQAFAMPDSTGAFTLNVVNSTYQLSALMTVLSADPPQSGGLINVTVPNVVVSGPTVQDVTAAPLGATSNISGQISDMNGVGVGNVGVTAFTMLTPAEIFLRSTATGSDGLYGLTVLANMPYTLGLTPSN